MKAVKEENIIKILDFLPYFQDNANQFYRVDTGLSLLDPYVYSEKVYEFILCLTEAGFVQPFNWTAWQKEAQKYTDDPKKLQQADMDTLRKLLTTFVRKERFCSGYLATVIDKGCIIAILERLEHITSSRKK